MKTKRFFTFYGGLAVLMLLISSCATNFTARLYQAGKEREAYTIPMGEDYQIWKLEGKYYAKATRDYYEKEYDGVYYFKYGMGYNYERKEAKSGEQVIIPLEKEKGKEAYQVLINEKIIAPNEFDWKKAKAIGKVEIANGERTVWNQRPKGKICFTGKEERHWYSYPCMAFLPVTATIDVVSIPFFFVFGIWMPGVYPEVQK